MGLGREKTTDHLSGFQQEIQAAAKQTPDVFFNWFNESGGDIEATFAKGEQDFLKQILNPCLPFLGETSKKHALEIGYGGGRLLAAASRRFALATGIDIHNQNDYVFQELNTRGLKNIKLIRSDGQHIPTEDACIDFIDSFIVLQHVEKLGVLKSYVKETVRVLKPGAIAILYVGRFYPFSKGRRSRLLLALDRLLAHLRPYGYKESLARVNAVNLRLTLKKAKYIAEQARLKVVSHGVSRSPQGA